MKELIRTSHAPLPVGPYNQAVKCNGFVFTAGQIAIDPETNELLEGDISVQTRLTLSNLKAVLNAAGSDLQYVVKTTVFLNDMNHFSAMNDVYAEFFSESAPARSAVEVSRLPKDVLVEIECVAAIAG